MSANYYNIVAKMNLSCRPLACLLLPLLALNCTGKRSAVSIPAPGNADAFTAKADTFAANAQYDGANFFLGKAMEIYRFEKRWGKAVQCLVQMGNNWQKIGDLERAKAAYAQALQITLERSEGRDLEISKSLMQLAFKLLAKREYASALEMLNRCLAIQQRIFGPDHPELGKVYNSLALLYLHMGDAQKSGEFASKSLSLKIRKFLNTSDSIEFKNYIFLDGVSIRGRDFSDMSGMLDRSLVVYMESLGGGHPLVAAIYEKLGMVCSLQGAYEQGLEFFRKALKISLDTLGEEDIRVAALYEEIGICLRLQGDSQNAGSYLRQALEIAKGARQPVILASIYFQLGKVCFMQDRYSEALQDYRLALDLLTPALAANAGDASAGTGTVAEKQNLLEILAAQAEAFAARAGMKLAEKSDLRDAFRSVQGAIRLIDALRMDYKSENYRLLFGEKSQHILDLAVDIALKLYRMTGSQDFKESAFIFSEKSKAALLSENLLESNARQFAGIPPEKLAREKELKNELSQLETVLEKQFQTSTPDATPTPADVRHRYYALLAEYQGLIASLERDYPRYFELKYGNRDVSPAALRKALPVGAALIEYFLGSTQLTIFFLSRDRFEAVSQPIGAEFSESVSAYCRAIKKIDESGFLELSPKLYRVLIAPLENWLRDTNKLLFIPDRFLAYLPFETLIREKKTGSDFSRLDFLVRRFAVSCHFSGHLWQSREQDHDPARPEVWAGFAPVFSGSERIGYVIRGDDPQDEISKREAATRKVTLEGLEFPELPGTENELRSIIGLFKAKKSKAEGFFRDQATEGMFKSPAMKEFTMIHLATHSLTNEANPKLSGFLFYPLPDDPAGEDGILYAGETYNLNLDCRLLVLSSCESGTGRLVAGEGLLALTRGLFYSGARNIVFSLWKVEDLTTGNLMVLLYQGILRGESFSQAMRKAKLAFIANPFTAFPKYWAGFILLGM